MLENKQKKKSFNEKEKGVFLAYFYYIRGFLLIRLNLLDKISESKKRKPISHNLLQAFLHPKEMKYLCSV